jgi:CBS domain containing-hemolysin-like protein
MMIRHEAHAVAGGAIRAPACPALDEAEEKTNSRPSPRRNSSRSSKPSRTKAVIDEDKTELIAVRAGIRRRHQPSGRLLTPRTEMAAFDIDDFRDRSWLDIVRDSIFRALPVYEDTVEQHHRRPACKPFPEGYG